MRNIVRRHCSVTTPNCEICGEPFGLARHYVCRTALCSTKCTDRFRVRRDDDRKWLHQAQTA
jgi:RNA polymerase-binding transcription factor DksA